MVKHKFLWGGCGLAVAAIGAATGLHLADVPWAAVLAGAGALLAGVGSLLSGLAALRTARNHGEEEAEQRAYKERWSHMDMAESD